MCRCCVVKQSHYPCSSFQVCDHLRASRLVASLSRPPPTAAGRSSPPAAAVNVWRACLKPRTRTAAAASAALVHARAPPPPAHGVLLGSLRDFERFKRTKVITGQLQLRRAVRTTVFGFAAGCLIDAHHCIKLICKNPPSRCDGGRQPTSATSSNSSSTWQ